MKHSTNKPSLVVDTEAEKRIGTLGKEIEGLRSQIDDHNVTLRRNEAELNTSVEQLKEKSPKLFDLIEAGTIDSESVRYLPETDETTLVKKTLALRGAVTASVSTIRELETKSAQLSKLKRDLHEPIKQAKLAIVRPQIQKRYNDAMAVFFKVVDQAFAAAEAADAIRIEALSYETFLEWPDDQNWAATDARRSIYNSALYVARVQARPVEAA